MWPGLYCLSDPADPSPDLVLDFTPPVADYLDLRNRLKAQHVCLETCFVQEQRLSGTVQVQNLCFKKSVSVRVTFDSWQSFKDVPCQYLNNVYGCDNTNTFSFSLELPELLELGSRVEFCIQYQAEDQTYWDNNHGTNYCLLVLDQVTEKTEKMEFDPYGSPRTSAGFFPEWQSWGRVDAHAPYWWNHIEFFLMMQSLYRWCHRTFILALSSHSWSHASRAKANPLALVAMHMRLRLTAFKQHFNHMNHKLIL